jgi:hypothetical protein
VTETSTDIEVRESEVLVVPGTGTVVNLAEPRECAIALQDIRDMEGRWREVKRILSNAIVAHWGHVGSAKTFSVGGGRKVEIKGGPERHYDAEAIRDDLIAAGMPDERVNEIVTTEVRYSVRAVEAKRAAAANPEYARIIERHTTEIERPYDVAVRRR